MPLLFLLIGGIFFLIAALFSKYEISSTMLLFFYISAGSLLIASFLFFAKKKKVILSNIVLFFLLIFILELSCFFILGMPVAYNKHFDPPNLPEDHILRNIGEMPSADTVYVDPVFDVNYSIDKNHLRITPEHDTINQEFALFFGCSIAYGFGLGSKETLPYYFQEASQKYNAYNYGYNGHGTNHMLARLEYQDLSKQVVENQGVAVYVFFWDHIYRAIGSMNRYTDWLNNAPYYTMEDDILVRKKMFNNGRFFISKTYEFLHQLSIIKQFGVDFPRKLNDHHFDLVSEMILESKNSYIQQFGNDQFYVAIYPSYVNYTVEEFVQFKGFLKKKGLKIIDLSKHIKYDSKHTLKGDPHPNAATNLLVATELWNRIDQSFDE